MGLIVVCSAYIELRNGVVVVFLCGYLVNESFFSYFELGYLIVDVYVYRRYCYLFLLIC